MQQAVKKQMTQPKIMDVLHGTAHTPPPVWVMRQAGRYLPEYQATRKQAGSFLDLCYTPQLACEVTLQPINRFDFDAAIIFSDILVIPQALGIELDFKEGVGPVLDIMQNIDNVEDLSPDTNKLQPVYEAIRLTRVKLPEDKALIGFCGAPWTLAQYMLDAKPSKDNLNTRRLAYESPQKFEEFLNVITQACVQHLGAQIEAGCDAVQIFDSWAANVPAELFESCVLIPLTSICRNLKVLYPHVPIIVFPKGLKERQLQALAAHTSEFAALGLDHGQDLTWASANLPENLVFQGNLDPAVLLTNPATVREQTLKMLRRIPRERPHIANLGHGITPATPVENVQAFIDTIRNV